MINAKRLLQEREREKITLRMNVDDRSTTLFFSLFQEFLKEVLTQLPSHYEVCGDYVLALYSKPIFFS